MTFLGNPCDCGYFLDYINDEEDVLLCSRCHYRKEKLPEGYWRCTNKGLFYEGEILEYHETQRLLTEILK